MSDPEMLADRGRPAVRIVRRYDHPIDRVWRAVTEPAHLAQWFPFGADLELRAGGKADFGEGGEGEVLAADPPRHLVFTWGGDRLEFTLAEEGGGTRFTLVHGFDDRGGAASFATGWEQCMAGLDEVLADRKPGDPGRGVARHEELAARFGLNEPQVDESPGGWTARFERQLVCPAETAWDLFFGGKRAPGAGAEFRAPQAPHVLLGTVIECERPTSFAFVVAEGEPGGEVRLRLGEGTGHGARLFLEVRGADPAELDAAVEQWGVGAVEHVAAEAARLATA
ncbi:SRPBCC family protein [Glycomyces albidus]|uniref:Toxin-antitoxin system toxin subunit n=1 Tax=Glycomyces albidus TaxID=2656774 RepID=A0A6L5G382_9ACTN|nr:SRPBCC family protein [Glycomyces albidus]MQM24120.1 toxin-antitoxin system toxin subunit [Glycomyces albidus]